MKLRRINVFERHAEKLFLALVALVFLGVLTRQFLGAGNTVKVASRTDVPIDRAFADVAETADRALQRIREPSVDPQALQPAPDLAPSYAKALAASPVGGGMLSVPLGPGVSESQAGLTGGVKQIATVLPDAPPPAKPVARPFVAALDPLRVAQSPELFDLAPTLARQQPHDIRAVTVEAVFDAAALKSALEADPDGPSGPLEAIPSPWWQAIDIFDVELERREVLADGSHSEPEVLAPIPGEFSMRDQLGKAADAREVRKTLAAHARDHGAAILRPPFLPMIAGEPWAPPSVAQSSGASPEVTRLQRELDDVNREIARIRTQIQGPDRGNQQPGARQSGSWSAAGGGMGPRPSSTPRPRETTTTSSDSDSRRKEALQKQLKEKEERRTKLEADLKSRAGGQASGDVTSLVRSALEEPVRRLNTGPSVRIWAHDITGHPGASYQYRMRVVLPNPLYGYEQSLDDAARQYAASPVMKSMPSEWSDPVMVDQDAYFFVTAARETQALGGGTIQKSASGEVFRLFYGYWRSVAVTLAPGDAAAGTLTLAGSWPDFKIQKDAVGAFAVQGQADLPSTFPLDAGGWSLIDVATSPALPDEREAILGTPAGDLAVRDPRSDRESQLLARLRESAKASAKGSVSAPGAGMPGGKPVNSPPASERPAEEAPPADGPTSAPKPLTDR